MGKLLRFPKMLDQQTVLVGVMDHIDSVAPGENIVVFSLDGDGSSFMFKRPVSAADLEIMMNCLVHMKRNLERKTLEKPSTPPA